MFWVDIGVACLTVVALCVHAVSVAVVECSCSCLSRCTVTCCSWRVRSQVLNLCLFVYCVLLLNMLIAAGSCVVCRVVLAVVSVHLLVLLIVFFVPGVDNLKV